MKARVFVGVALVAGFVVVAASCADLIQLSSVTFSEDGGANVVGDATVADARIADAGSPVIIDASASVGSDGSFCQTWRGSLDGAIASFCEDFEDPAEYAAQWEPTGTAPLNSNGGSAYTYRVVAIDAGSALELNMLDPIAFGGPFGPRHDVAVGTNTASRLVVDYALDVVTLPDTEPASGYSYSVFRSVIEPAPPTLVYYANTFIREGSNNGGANFIADPESNGWSHMGVPLKAVGPVEIEIILCVQPGCDGVTEAGVMAFDGGMQIPSTQALSPSIHVIEVLPGVYGVAGTTAMQPHFNETHRIDNIRVAVY